MSFRRTSRELAKFPHEVSLIGVTAFGRRLRSSRGAVDFSKQPEGVLKPRDAREPFRRHSDQRLESAFEMAARHTEMAREAID